MRKAAAILAVVMVWLCGCTRNDGDIGPLFGTWQLTEREVTGEEVSAPLPPVKGLFWSFQSSVIEMKHVYGTSRYESVYGNWDLQGKTLTLDFPDPAQPMLEEFLLPRRCEVEVTELDGKNLHVEYRMEGGGEVKYKFRKR